MICSSYKTTLAALLLATCSSFALANMPFGVAAAEEEGKQATPAQARREISLNDLEDRGIALQQIEQQAINIYREAARVKLGPDASPNVPEIKSIPYELQSKELLPPQRQWLKFYLGSLEPVVRRLAAEVGTFPAELNQGIPAGYDKMSGAYWTGLNPGIPAEYDKTFGTYWKAWGAGVNQLTEHLEELLQLIDDSVLSHAKIQQVAVSVYKDGENLEQLRKTIFTAFREAKKADPNFRILISPPPY